MKKFKNRTICIVLIAIGLCLYVEDSNCSMSFESATCKLLTNDIVALSPWTLYPIIFEPIKRGRLTIWAGVTTLPTSEFRCFAGQDSNRTILIEFTDYSNKLEWSFKDLNRNTTHFGNTISHVDGVHFRLTINNDQMNSYLDCNKVKHVELLQPEDSIGYLITSCLDCTAEVIPLIEVQIKELIKTKFNDQIINKLFWDVNQLVYTHHFDHPMSVQD